MISRGTAGSNWRSETDLIREEAAPIYSQDAYILSFSSRSQMIGQEYNLKRLMSRDTFLVESGSHRWASLPMGPLGIDVRWQQNPLACGACD